MYSTQLPPDNWAGVLDHLAIGLVDNKYTKLGKIDVTYFGVSPYKSPIVLVPVIGYIHFSMGLIESFFYVLNNLSRFLEMCIHGHTGFAS